MSCWPRRLPWKPTSGARWQWRITLRPDNSATTISTSRRGVAPDESRPLVAFARIWTEWTGVRAPKQTRSRAAIFQRKKPAAIGVKAPYPGFIEPALATSIDKVPSGERWIPEIKFDGYPVQVHLANNGVKVFTRRPDDVRAHQRHAGAKPACRASFQSVAERQASGAPEAGAGSMKKAGSSRGFRLLWRAKLADKPCRNRWQLHRINLIAFQAPKRARPFTVNQHHHAAAVLASPR
jgi:hypothetical protein